jgi:hypothetical protein
MLLVRRARGQSFGSTCEAVRNEIRGNSQSLADCIGNSSWGNVIYATSYVTGQGVFQFHYFISTKISELYEFYRGAGIA